MLPHKTAKIHLKSGNMQAEILPIGATLARLSRQGRDLILGNCDLTDPTINYFYSGTIVGPIANRVSGGLINVDDQTFQMECNEAGITSLHSGSDGLHALCWTVRKTAEDSVLLEVHLPNGHSNLPGNRIITVLYRLLNDGLTVTITAETDQKTPINIAHHPYWALQADQSKIQLTVQADTYLPKKQDGVPTGEERAVVGSSFDFRSGREVGEKSTLDHNWCLSEKKHSIPRHVATLRAEDGLQLDIATTEVGLQVYTGSGLPLVPAGKSTGPAVHPNAGIAIEPQGWPDAPNQSTFPTIMVDAGNTYRQITRYTYAQN